MSYLVPNTRRSSSFQDMVWGVYSAHHFDGNKINSAKTLENHCRAHELNYLKINFSLYGKIIFTFFNPPLLPTLNSEIKYLDKP